VKLSLIGHVHEIDDVYDVADCHLWPVLKDNFSAHIFLLFLKKVRVYCAVSYTNNMIFIILLGYGQLSI
jgi:hypothetical protein